jgi:hypothetical protein
VRRLMEVEPVTRAATAGRTPDRLNHRNGSKGIDWDTQAGPSSIVSRNRAEELTFPFSSNRSGWPKEAPTAMVQEPCVQRPLPSPSMTSSTPLLWAARGRYEFGPFQQPVCATGHCGISEVVPRIGTCPNSLCLMIFNLRRSRSAAKMTASHCNQPPNVSWSKWHV